MIHCYSTQENEMYEIFKATPEAKTRHTTHKYPWAQMKVGNAINIPADDPAARRHPNSGSCNAATSAYAYGKRHGMKFTTRRMTDDSINIYLVEEL